MDRAHRFEDAISTRSILTLISQPMQRATANVEPDQPRRLIVPASLRSSRAAQISFCAFKLACPSLPTMMWSRTATPSGLAISRATTTGDSYPATNAA